MEGRIIRSSGKVAVVELKQEPRGKILDKLVTIKINVRAAVWTQTRICGFCAINWRRFWAVQKRKYTSMRYGRRGA